MGLKQTKNEKSDKKTEGRMRRREGKGGMDKGEK
jgi:hypothetical protein